MNKKRKLVSDHALVRWLERAYGWDMEGLRRELEEIVSDAVSAGATQLRKDGCVFVFADGCLLTVIPAEKGNAARLAGRREALGYMR